MGVGVGGESGVDLGVEDGIGWDGMGWDGGE